MLELLQHFCGRHTFVPLDAYPFTFGAPATGTHIRQSRATQGKGLGMEYCFFAHLECPQLEGAIGSQVPRGCLIESDAPVMKGAKIKEATRYLLKSLWRAYRVTRHYCDITHQSIVHQSLSPRCQEMHILRSQAKERKSMTAIGADQFCIYMRGLGTWFLWRGVCNSML